MGALTVDEHDGIATVILSRGKVNAINADVVGELRDTFETLERDTGVRAVVLTGRGRFFSFGFDIPEFLSVSRDQFTRYVTAFTSLYSYLFGYPKPLVAALNGHTIAGGCMLALACDHRVMAEGNAKISLNEITFGAAVFAGSVELLRFWVGSANATTILCSGDMFSSAEAQKLGLVHESADPGRLITAAVGAASRLSSKSSAAFRSIKSLLRTPILNEMASREAASIREFVEIWYSEATWADLQHISIR